MNLIETRSQLIGEKVTEFFSTRKAGAAYHSFIDEIYASLEEFCLRRGKRIASCTTLYAYEGYAGGIDEEILKACVGVELYRHGILIHDDLVDEDDERRGGKAFHRLFNERERLGIGVAVFSGNLLYALSLEALAEAGFEKEKIDRVRELLIEEYRNVNESQCLDLFFEFKEPSVEEWRLMASKRAASLFRTTIMAGAILGSAPKEDLPLLETAAKNVGYSFDITDDIIGTFASEEEYGRTPGGDIRLGKKPLHVVYALNLLDKKEKEELRSLLEKREVTSGDIERVKDMIRECGALEKAKNDSKKYAEKAKKIIAETHMSSGTKENFEELIDYASKNLDWYI